MGIVGPFPETGLRIDFERPVAGGPPWRYEGTVATPEAQFHLHAQVTEEGGVAIETADPLPEGVVQKAKLLLRAAWKHAGADAAPPPRRIVRWRA
jgi:hypothetical protein